MQPVGPRDVGASVISTHDSDLLRHRQSFSFYYDRAVFNEVLAMDALYFVRRSLNLAVNTKTTGFPAELVVLMNKMTDVLELQFMDLAQAVYLNPTYDLLNDEQRERIKAECFSIEFDADDPT